MTEQQKDEHFLADLLQLPSEASDSASSHGLVLSRREEQNLLREANRAEPVTLAPTPATGNTTASFTTEIIETVQRHPVPAVLIAMGIAYLLTRRQR